MSYLRISHVTKSFGTNAVLKDIDLDIQDGEFIALVGPSGCGKSTLMRIVAGLEAATSGEISMDGRVVNDVAPRDRDVAMVFQNYALYPHLTVRDNLAFAMTMRRLPAAEIAKRTVEVATMLGLGELLERLPKALSGGQRQRVAMGRAIMRKPRLFLFDEPLSNLDAKLRVHMRLEIAQLHKKLKATSIFVTHDQVEAMTMADRIVLLNDGVIQQVGTPKELYDKPANLFVANFIGSPSMTMVPVEGNSTASQRRALGTVLPAGVPEQARQMGLRPEAVQIAHSGEGVWPATVMGIEDLGYQSFVFCEMADGTRLSSLSHGSGNVHVGESVSLQPDFSQAHYFGDSGLRLN
jgi:multiple sugar transport system ATP-binding protein